MKEGGNLEPVLRLGKKLVVPAAATGILLLGGTGEAKAASDCGTLAPEGIVAPTAQDSAKILSVLLEQISPEQITQERHTIQKGDTIYKITRQILREANVSINPGLLKKIADQIIESNGIENPQLIQPGQIISVPSSEKLREMIEEESRILQERVAEAAEATDTVFSDLDLGDLPNEIVFSDARKVRSGDSVEAVVRQIFRENHYSESSASIKKIVDLVIRLNEISDPRKIQPGQTIYYPVGDQLTQILIVRSDQLNRIARVGGAPAPEEQSPNPLESRQPQEEADRSLEDLAGKTDAAFAALLERQAPPAPEEVSSEFQIPELPQVSAEQIEQAQSAAGRWVDVGDANSIHDLFRNLRPDFYNLQNFPFPMIGRGRFLGGESVGSENYMLKRVVDAANKGMDEIKRANRMIGTRDLDGRSQIFFPESALTQDNSEVSKSTNFILAYAIERDFLEIDSSEFREIVEMVRASFEAKISIKSIDIARLERRLSTAQNPQEIRNIVISEIYLKIVQKNIGNLPFRSFSEWNGFERKPKEVFLEWISNLSTNLSAEQFLRLVVRVSKILEEHQDFGTITPSEIARVLGEITNERDFIHFFSMPGERISEQESLRLQQILFSGKELSAAEISQLMNVNAERTAADFFAGNPNAMPISISSIAQLSQTREELIASEQDFESLQNLLELLNGSESQQREYLEKKVERLRESEDKNAAEIARLESLTDLTDFVAAEKSSLENAIATFREQIFKRALEILRSWKADALRADPTNEFAVEIEERIAKIIADDEDSLEEVFDVLKEAGEEITISVLGAILINDELTKLKNLNQAGVNDGQYLESLIRYISLLPGEELQQIAFSFLDNQEFADLIARTAEAEKSEYENLLFKIFLSDIAANSEIWKQISETNFLEDVFEKIGLEELSGADQLSLFRVGKLWRETISAETGIDQKSFELLVRASKIAIENTPENWFADGQRAQLLTLLEEASFKDSDKIVAFLNLLSQSSAEVAANFEREWALTGNTGIALDSKFGPLLSGRFELPNLSTAPFASIEFAGEEGLRGGIGTEVAKQLEIFLGMSDRGIGGKISWEFLSEQINDQIEISLGAEISANWPIILNVIGINPVYGLVGELVMTGQTGVSLQTFAGDTPLQFAPTAKINFQILPFGLATFWQDGPDSCGVGSLISQTGVWQKMALEMAQRRARLEHLQGSIDPEAAPLVLVDSGTGQVWQRTVFDFTPSAVLGTSLDDQQAQITASHAIDRNTRILVDARTWNKNKEVIATIVNRPVDDILVSGTVGFFEELFEKQTQFGNYSEFIQHVAVGGSVRFENGEIFDFSQIRVACFHSDGNTFDENSRVRGGDAQLVAFGVGRDFGWIDLAAEAKMVNYSPRGHESWQEYFGRVGASREIGGFLTEIFAELGNKSSQVFGANISGGGEIFGKPASARIQLRFDNPDGGEQRTEISLVGGIHAIQEGVRSLSAAVLESDTRVVIEQTRVQMAASGALTHEEAVEMMAFDGNEFRDIAQTISRESFESGNVDNLAISLPNNNGGVAINSASANQIATMTITDSASGGFNAKTINQMNNAANFKVQVNNGFGWVDGGSLNSVTFDPSTGIETLRINTLGLAPGNIRVLNTVAIDGIAPATVFMSTSLN